jgi:cyclopropane fatty-acyl-phospholipid synthase-like methyltransferase
MAATRRLEDFAGAARRVGPPLVGLVPAGLRPRLAELHRPLARRVAADRYRRKYGAPFLAEIHDDDDLLRYSLDVAAGERALRYFHGARMYFQGGEWNAAEVEKVLRDHGISLRDAGSVLEFACGWGRVTRHLVHLVDPARITVSDIDHRAVDFVRSRLGVRGFPSTPTAAELEHAGRYDVIAVVSLFSHLALGDWGPWLRKLGELLAPDGVLLLSTLGMHAFAVNTSEADRPAFRTETDGFLFRAVNETGGRLDAAHYGVAYVDDAYVRRAAAEHFPGRFVAFCPRALNGFQDVYVLRGAAAAA